MSTYALAARVRSHHRVDHEGVDRAVPCDVDEPDEAVAVAGANPSEAVLSNLGLPVVVENLVLEPLGMQRVHVRIVEVAAPLVHEGHGDNVASNHGRASRIEVR